MSTINLIDIEASGLHFDSYPIEVAIKVNDEIQTWLIKPEPHWTYWCSTAESLHGISRATLNREGLPAATVAEQIVQYLEDSDGLLYSDAAYWDADWINTLWLLGRIGFMLFLIIKPIQTSAPVNLDHVF